MSVHNRNEVTLFAAPGSCSPVNSEVEAIVDNLGQNGATDSTNSPIMVQVVNTLMQHRKNVLHLNYNESRNEANFARRAIASLIKRLKNDRNSLIGFYSAVVSEGGDVSCCACLPRSLDGRLQIAGHKGFPHLTYINLFRYPKAVKHDVVSLAVCRFPFHLKLDKVCINPYHYTLVSSESQPYMQSFSSAIESEPLKVVFPNLACGSSMSEHTTAVPQIPFSSLQTRILTCLLLEKGTTRKQTSQPPFSHYPRHINKHLQCQQIDNTAEKSPCRPDHRVFLHFLMRME